MLIEEVFPPIPVSCPFKNCHQPCVGNFEELARGHYVKTTSDAYIRLHKSWWVTGQVTEPYVLE